MVYLYILELSVSADSIDIANKSHFTYYQNVAFYKIAIA